LAIEWLQRNDKRLTCKSISPLKGLCCILERTAGRSGLPTLSDKMCSSISLRESTPPQKRQFNVSISKSESYVDDFVRELTVQNWSINTLGAMIPALLVWGLGVSDWYLLLGVIYVYI